MVMSSSLNNKLPEEDNIDVLGTLQKGVLTTSIILDQIPAIQLPTFSLAAGLAVIYAVEDLLPDLQKLQFKMAQRCMFK
jgi:hypothetical protein